MVYFTLMKNFLEHKYTFPVILLLALILRLIPACSAISSESRLLRPDSSGYLDPARELVQNGTYSTTRRPPGYPVFAAAVYALGGNNTAIVFLQVLLSVAACAVTAFAAKEYGGRICGNIAAILMAANLTAIANAPLLLSDTLFSLFAAGEFFFFIRYRNTKQLLHLLLCTAIAGVAVLIRPINQLFIIVITTMIIIMPKLNWQKKLLHAASAALLFLLIITPWMLRNYLAGATFDIDTNTGAMRHQNGAMLMAKVNGTDFESEKAKLIKIENETFADTEKFPDERSREAWRKAQFRKMVLKHPFTYLSQHFDIFILLPDAPSFLECFGTTSSDRGTMGVLKKDGIFAAIRHYFGENYLLCLSMLIPLLIPTFILYAALIMQLFKDIFSIKRFWLEIMIFLAFAEYFLFLPGSITAPRYQLPALPCICTLAACAILSFLQDKHEVENKLAGEVEA